MKIFHRRKLLAFWAVALVGLLLACSSDKEYGFPPDKDDYFVTETTFENTELNRSLLIFRAKESMRKRRLESKRIADIRKVRREGLKWENPEMEKFEKDLRKELATISKSSSIAAIRDAEVDFAKRMLGLVSSGDVELEISRRIFPIDSGPFTQLGVVSIVFADRAGKLKGSMMVEDVYKNYDGDEWRYDESQIWFADPNREHQIKAWKWRPEFDAL